MNTMQSFHAVMREVLDYRKWFEFTLECQFNFMINSQVLWGDYDTMPGLAIYQLLRPENAKFVTVIKYVWNGKEKLIVADKGL